MVCVVVMAWFVLWLWLGLHWWLWLGLCCGYGLGCTGGCGLDCVVVMVRNCTGGCGLDCVVVMTQTALVVKAWIAFWLQGAAPGNPQCLDTKTWTHMALCVPFRHQPAPLGQLLTLRSCFGGSVALRNLRHPVTQNQAGESC